MTLDVRWAAEKWPLTGLLPRVANARPWDMKAGQVSTQGGPRPGSAGLPESQARLVFSRIPGYLMPNFLEAV